MNQKRYGMRKEEQVADFLARRGARIALAPGSRGPADVLAEWRNGPRLLIQVKASRMGKPAMPTPREVGRLRRSAVAAGATPVVAKVVGNSVSFLPV